MKKQKKSQTNGYKFGTFKGVFTPSILTILGIVMYLRMGWVLGNVGLFKTLLIITISTAITLITSLSLSALATNMNVKGGGAYYIISRSLGLEAGAAIGIPLFIAQSLGVSFYIIGFSESLAAVFPQYPIIYVSCAVLVFLTLLTLVSADFTLKLQFVIFGLICASLVSFFFGTTQVNILPVGNVPFSESFWVVFAVFFPAVTGIEAGLAMSGDLKNPEKSLPNGTLWAIGVSYIIYMAIPIFMNFVVTDVDILKTNLFIMKDIARWGDLILLGVWGASLSSATGALLGAPRTIQALSKDKVLPKFLGRGFGSGNDPRFATVFTCVIAVIGILSGGLNVIAPVLSMFFLISYGLLNLASAFEGLIASPSWRPTFKTKWYRSLVGSLGCLFVMMMINSGATIMAVILTTLIYIFVGRRDLKANWDDIRFGIFTLGLSYIVYKLEEYKPDIKTWRPNILVLSGSPKERWPLIELSKYLTHGRGLMTVSSIVPYSFKNVAKIQKLKLSIQNYLKRSGILALVNIHSETNLFKGMSDLVNTYGFGPIIPNTVLLGDTEKRNYIGAYSKFIRLIHLQSRNLLILRNEELEIDFTDEMKIEILWGGIEQNIGLMLALSHLLKTYKRLQNTSLTIKTFVTENEDIEKVTKKLKKLIKHDRIDCKLEVFQKSEKDIFLDIKNHTKQATLLFMGLRPPREKESDADYSVYYKKLLKKTKDFPPTVFVLASEKINFNHMFKSTKGTGY